MSLRRGAIFAFLVCIGWPSRAEAQVGFRAEGLVNNRYIWRGIRRAAGGNAQLQLSASLGKSVQVAAGAWGNFELSTHRDGQLSELRPGHWGLSEANGWAEVSRQFHRVSVAAGLVLYGYSTAPAKFRSTAEAYARWRGVLGNRFRVSPELSAWYDFGKRNSGYLEASLTAPILALPFLTPSLLAYTSATAGIAIGKPDHGEVLAPSSFRSSGFTHADFAAGVRVRATPIRLNVAGHLFRANDLSTRRHSLDPTHLSSRLRVYVTIEAGLAFSSDPR